MEIIVIDTQILDFIQTSLHIKKTNELQSLLGQLDSLFEYDGAYCVYLPETSQQSELSHKKPAHKIISNNIPTDYINDYINSSAHLRDPVVKDSIMGLGTSISWQTSFARHPDMPSLAPKYGLMTGYSGIMPITNGSVVLSFANCTKPKYRRKSHLLVEESRAKFIVEIMTPHLGECLRRCLGARELNTLHLKMLLTDRELEILKWIMTGKSAYEISLTLSGAISKRTVESHLLNIKNKLGATNLSHAVAIACRAGIY